MRRFWRRAGDEPAASEAAVHASQGDTSGSEATEALVVGERQPGTVHRALSLQSRVSNGLAFTLLGGLSLGLLLWYYMHSFSNRANERVAAQAGTRAKAEGEMTLPSLGRIDPPAVAPPPVSALERSLGPPPEEPARFAPSWMDPREPTTTQPAPTMKSPQELAFERRLAGRVFAAAGEGRVAAGREGTPGVDAGTPTAAGARGGSSDLDALLATRTTPAVEARVLPTMRLLLPKGAFVDCTLETAIDSSLPGMTTCVTATDTFGVDGAVVLLERGTKLVGETRGQVRQGMARIFVLWTEARTPTGVIVPLASPGTDELGRSGLPGEVDRHFWDRFGAAILVSVIDGAVQAGIAAQRDGGETIIYNPSASSDILTEVLRSTINIPPTITKAQGDRLQVLVARDLDFRSVYALRLLDAER